ncbi:MAG: archaemetzincin family Zn-dependent metalloprotease [Planctomycetes bacterium]|nr:archaemetzincin family Zn-dependent metalloprotease [Planctomycetota bacterium]
MAMLHVVPIFCGDRSDVLGPLAQRIAATFELDVEHRAPAFDPEVAFDASRGQYDSRVLLQHLRDTTPREATRVLGVASVDLFIPVLTYVFGEAELDGRSALISSFRLDNELYGLEPDPQLMFERLVKEAMHELGHTFALLHCRRSDCVMSSSTYVEGIDLKPDRFCDRCLRALRRKLGNSKIGRRR